MPSWFPRSIFALVFVTIYLVVAIIAVANDRRDQGGGWITLKGIGAYLVTFPASFLGEAVGLKPHYQRNLDMAMAIGICAVLVYFLGAGMAWLARALFSAAGVE